MTPKRPRNPNQLAKAIIDIATGEHLDAPPDDSFIIVRSVPSASHEQRGK
jgi:hypothetical protein